MIYLFSQGEYMAKEKTQGKTQAAKPKTKPRARQASKASTQQKAKNQTKPATASKPKSKVKQPDNSKTGQAAKPKTKSASRTKGKDRIAATGNERIYYNADAIKVTNSRFMVPGKTYSIRNVTSVEFLRKRPSLKGPIITIILGMVIFVASTVYQVGLLVSAAGVLWLLLRKTVYIVVLASASAETEALTSTDKDLVMRVVAALNDAIAH